MSLKDARPRARQPGAGPRLNISAVGGTLPYKHYTASARLAPYQFLSPQSPY